MQTIAPEIRADERRAVRRWTIVDVLRIVDGMWHAGI